MNQIIRKKISLIAVLGLMAFYLSGCYETHYYHHYHHHTRGWYDSRHQPYPAGVDFKVDVR